MFQTFKKKVTNDGNLEWVSVCDLCARTNDSFSLSMKTTLIPLSPLLQDLTPSDRVALWKAWKTDQEREKKIKKKTYKGESKEKKTIEDGCLTKFFTGCFPPHKDILTDIHDDALKLQTRIAKNHLTKARGPLLKSIQNKVRWTFPSLSLLSWFC